MSDSSSPSSCCPDFNAPPMGIHRFDYTFNTGIRIRGLVDERGLTDETVWEKQDWERVLRVIRSDIETGKVRRVYHAFPRFRVRFTEDGRIPMTAPFSEVIVHVLSVDRE